MASTMSGARRGRRRDPPDVGAVDLERLGELCYRRIPSGVEELLPVEGTGEGGDERLLGGGLAALNAGEAFGDDYLLPAAEALQVQFP